MSKIWLSFAVILLISSCANPKISIPVPSRPDLPTLTKEQDLSIPDDIYSVLIEREILLKAHIDLLEDLIKANNGD